MTDQPQERREAVMELSLELLHEVLRLPDNVQIEATSQKLMWQLEATSQKLMWQQSTLLLRLASEEFPVLAAKDDEPPKIEAVYCSKQCKCGNVYPRFVEFTGLPTEKCSGESRVTDTPHHGGHQEVSTRDGQGNRGCGTDV